MLERKLMKIVLVLLTVAAMVVFLNIPSDAMWQGQKGKKPKTENDADANAQRMLKEGKETFRFDTFGDEAFWSDALQLHPRRSRDSGHTKRVASITMDGSRRCGM